MDGCKLKTSRIDWVLLGLLLIIIIGIPSTVLISQIIWGTIRRFRRRRREREDQDGNEETFQGGISIGPMFFPRAKESNPEISENSSGTMRTLK